MNDIDIMKLAIKESQKSLKKQNIPVGAVIIKNGEVIAKGFNNYKKNIDEHAEIIAINKAIKKLGNQYLDGCELYVTMEPCLMCYGAIARTNINKIVFGVKNEKMGFSKYINYIPKIDIKWNVEANEIKKILADFFKNKRN